MTPARFTPEVLQAAYSACKRRAWPGTYDECMADPLISRMIMLYALHGRAQKKHTPQAYTRKRYAQSTGLDQKRLASGEREDD